MSFHNPTTLIRNLVLGFAVTVSLSGVVSAQAVRGTRKPAPTGAQIFRQQCAACHGARGEGAKGHPKPLIGSRSVGELAAFIQKSMPPGAARKLPAADAGKVAAHIHDAFYSPLAQERNRPARIELSRLTVRQYRNALADLVGSFRPAPGGGQAFQRGDRSAPRTEASTDTETRSQSLLSVLPAKDPARGLRGQYFNAQRRRRGGDGREPLIDRVDPEIRFDWAQGTPPLPAPAEPGAGAAPSAPASQGTPSPAPPEAAAQPPPPAMPAEPPPAFDPYQFSIRWEGAVVAPETGEYEFIVRTEHAVQLWLNDPERPLIDAMVKSGNDNEYRATLTLLGGRAYPLRLDFSKGVTGVNDLTKLKEKPPAKATLALEWKPPKRAAEVIPQRHLIPLPAPEAFVVTTPFPPDDRSIGYERGTSVSKAWEEATTEAALEAVGYVAAHLNELSGVPDDAPDRAARLQAFCRRFIERAFRRPLSEDLSRSFIDGQFAQAPDPEAAVKRVLLLTLKSPRFLYREIGSDRPDAYDVASRLSFGLWDSLPDEELLKAAAAGGFATRAQVVKQAERMVADPRAWSKLREFFLQWLKVDHHPDLAKDPKRYPGFDEATQSDLRASLELFLEHVVWGERSDFRELLLTNRVFLNGRLARMYGAKLPPDAPFQPVSLDPAERAGVLTHPYLMASFAYLDTSSPIHRGVLIARNLLGRALQPPPEAFTPLPAELHPELTTRERVALQTRPAGCVSCHAMINPLGFTLEKFDAIGRVRARENGKPVDSSGLYRTRAGKTVRFNGVRDLARFLATSEEAHLAFVERLFHHVVKQPARAYGPQTLTNLRLAFAKNGFNIRRQLVETTATTALAGAKPLAARGKPATPPQAGGRPNTSTRSE